MIPSKAHRVILIPVALMLLSTASLVSRAESSTAAEESNAVVINLAERDLNVLLREAFASAGGSRIEGRREKISRGVSDVHYSVDLSVPVLELEEQGRMSLRLDVLQADVKIGRIERRIGKRLAHCEGAGIVVAPDRPLALNASFRFELTDGALNVVPEALSLDNARKDLRLRKPVSCHNAILPRWLLWWIGKPYLRRRINRLDEVMLARMQRNAEDLSRSGGLLHDYLNGTDGEMGLSAQTLDTSHESLLMILGGSAAAAAADAPTAPDWVADERDHSFLGVSESFLNRRLAAAFPGRPTEPSKPKGNLRKLARSRSLYTLVPGLRAFESTENLFFSITLPAPRVEFDSIDRARAGLDPSIVGEPVVHHGKRAVIRLHLAGVELNVWKIDNEQRTPLGTLKIDSARVAVVPFVSILGGVSFELVENVWKLSSSGVEFSEHMLAATIQEMVFGEIFQTRYEPLFQGALSLGDASLAPIAFRTIDGYLVIELGAGSPPTPRRTDNLLASR